MHERSASILLARKSTNRVEVLLHRHKKSGSWLQPGGKSSSNEHGIVTAIREFREETGLIVHRDFDFLGAPNSIPTNNTTVSVIPSPIVTNIIPAFNLIDDMYAAVATSHNEPTVSDTRESDVFKWFDSGDLARQRSDLPENVRITSQFIIANVLSMPVIPLAAHTLGYLCSNQSNLFL